MDEHPAGRRPEPELAPFDPPVVRVGENGFAGEPVARSIAHQAPGVLHVAVSLQVIDAQHGGWLVQRRAPSKPLFANCWANSCCTHPAPGEDLASAAMRRLRAETGLVVAEVVPVGSFTYRAVDPSSGLVEHEHDHVFFAFADTSAATPDPQEITDLEVLPFGQALDLVRSGAGAPWAAEVLLRSHTALNGGRP